MSSRPGEVISLALSQGNVSEILTEEREVFGSAYKEVVDFIGEYHVKYGEPPTPATVNKHFGDDVVEDKAEGNLRYAMDSMRSDYVKSEVDNMLVQVSKNISTAPSNELLNKIISRASQLQRLTQRVKDVDITDVDQALKDFARARIEDTDGAGIMTGIEAWDEALPMGMRPGNLITVMGYSGKGKSFITARLAAEAYKQGKTVLIVSLEMSADDQRSRIWSVLAEGRFFVNDLANGKISDDEATSWGMQNLKTGGKIIIIEQDGQGDTTPSSIQAKIDKHRPHIVIWDYLQLMMDNQRHKDMTPRMMNLSRELKVLATSNKIVCISVTAVTDLETKKRDAPPLMSQVAWSKGIEFDSDLVIVVHKYDNPDIIEIVARKSRRSPLFAMKFFVDLSRGIFEPIMGGEEYED